VPYARPRILKPLPRVQEIQKQDTSSRLWALPITVFKPSDDLTDIEKACIAEYNNKLGREIFKADPSPQSPYLKFEAASPGKCSIGVATAGANPQIVGYKPSVKLGHSPKQVLCTSWAIASGWRMNKTARVCVEHG
jgi:hypothetical protein